MEKISSSVVVDEHYLSPGSDQELLFVNHTDKTSHGNSADVSSSEDGTSNSVGSLTTIHSSSGGTAAEKQSKVTLKREITAFSGVFVVIKSVYRLGHLHHPVQYLELCRVVWSELALLGVWRDSGSGWGNVLP